MNATGRESPDVSVIIPTYNRRASLERAIESCFEGNEVVDIEIVVVDDGSTDGTEAWLKSLSDERVSYSRQENRGAQVARNSGLDCARGQYVKFLDDDDELLPGALVQEIEAVSEEQAAISCGHLIVRSPYGQRVFEQEPNPDLISGIFRGSVWTHAHAFVYRADILQECRWDPAVPYHQDTAFAIEAATLGRSETTIDRPVAVYHNHEGASISTDKKSHASPVERATLQVDLIERGVERLREHDALESYHVEAAADGMWRCAHIVSAYDLSTFKEIYRKIQALHPSFTPSREHALMSALDTLIGAHRTEYITYPLRRGE